MNLDTYDPAYTGLEEAQDSENRYNFLYDTNPSEDGYYGDIDQFTESIDNYYDELDNNLINISEAGSTSFGASYSSGGINFKRPQKRVAKKITKKEDIDYILSIDHSKASEKSTIMEIFGDFGEGSRFNPYDIIEIPPKAYGGLSKIDKDCISSTKINSSKFTTTIGLWIFNKSFIEPMSDILGYINTPVTGDVYENINLKISYALLEDKINVQQLKNFIMQSQILMSCCSALSPSHTETIFSMEQEISKKKDELNKKYEKKLKENDLVTAKKYEEELISYTKDILKDDPAVDMFNSGARSSWGNNVKNMYLTRGPLKGTDGNYSFISSSYIEGLNPKDFKAASDAGIGGPYSRSKLTASGGYTEKLFTYSTQHLKILPKGSDCGSKDTIEVSLTNKNAKDWFYSYIKDGNKLVEFTPDIKDKYVGKTVRFRFSSLCKSKDGICEACAGTFFNRLGIENLGVASMIMMSSLKNAQMKRFHNSTLSLTNIDVNELF